MKKLFSIILAVGVVLFWVGTVGAEDTKTFSIRRVWSNTLNIEPQSIIFPSSEEATKLIERKATISPEMITTEKSIEFFDFEGKSKSKINIEINQKQQKSYIKLSNDRKKLFIVTNTDTSYSFRILDTSGNTLSVKQFQHQPNISDDGDFLLVRAVESYPMESFVVYDSNGIKLWERANHKVTDAKIFDNGSVVSIEDGNNNKRNLIFLEKTGSIKWQYDNIEPLAADYTFLLKNNVLILSPNTFPSNLYAFDAQNGKLLWRQENSENIPEQISENGSLLVCEDRKGILLIDAFSGRVEGKKSGLKGMIKISSNGQFVAISNFPLKLNKDNLFVLEKNGKTIWSKRTFNKKIEKIGFVVDTQFFYTDGKTINLEKIVKTGGEK